MINDHHSRYTQVSPGLVRRAKGRLDGGSGFRYTAFNRVVTQAVRRPGELGLGLSSGFSVTTGFGVLGRGGFASPMVSNSVPLSSQRF